MSWWRLAAIAAAGAWVGAKRAVVEAIEMEQLLIRAVAVGGDKADALIAAGQYRSSFLDEPLPCSLRNVIDHYQREGQLPVVLSSATSR